MSDIQFLDNEFVINGVSSAQVAKTLQDSGFKNTAIAEIIGNWFIGVTGTVQPVGFQFQTDVETPNPDCGITYKRSFSHADWIDGESRVQAGMTPEELGFNARFHAIENEFDSIANQFTRIGNCMSELRSDLIGIVNELESKITALQNSIHETKPPPVKDLGFLGPVQLGEQTGILTKFGDDFEIIKYEPVKPPQWEIPKKDRIVFEPKEANPEDLITIVTDLPDVFTKEPGLEDLFGEGKNPTVGDIRRFAPNATLPSGVSLGSVIANMPAETKFNDINDAVSKITEHVVSQLDGNQTKAVREKVVKTDRTGTALINSGVAVLGVEETIATALSSAGLGTVSKLSGASTTEIATALSSAGLDTGLAKDLFAKAALTKALRNG